INQIALAAKLCRLPESDWPAVAILKLRSVAQVWGQNLFEVQPDVTWPDFKAAFNRQFGSEELESAHRANLAAVTWE
ncbi:hypothetical protein BGZ95_008576, partial [Linnemannia exigua]